MPGTWDKDQANLYNSLKTILQGNRQNTHTHTHTHTHTLAHSKISVLEAVSRKPDLRVFLPGVVVGQASTLSVPIVLPFKEK